MSEAQSGIIICSDRDCGHPNAHNAQYCARCGKRLHARRKKPPGLVGAFIRGLILLPTTLGLLGVLVGLGAGRWTTSRLLEVLLRAGFRTPGKIVEEIYEALGCPPLFVIDGIWGGVLGVFVGLVLGAFVFLLRLTRRI